MIVVQVPYGCDFQMTKLVLGKRGWLLRDLSDFAKDGVVPKDFASSRNLEGSEYVFMTDDVGMLVRSGISPDLYVRPLSGLAYQKLLRSVGKAELAGKQSSVDWYEDICRAGGQTKPMATVEFDYPETFPMAVLRSVVRWFGVDRHSLLTD